MLAAHSLMPNLISLLILRDELSVSLFSDAVAWLLAFTSNGHK